MSLANNVDLKKEEGAKMTDSCNSNLLIGCVADDFTGASDIASFFSMGGLNVLLINNIPDINYKPDNDIQVIVIALKSRTVEVEQAVEDSLNAFRFLLNKGCKQLYFKYCSTFDSTKRGNIGPVIDAILEEFNIKYTIISPALPVNGRIVKNGNLYVNGIQLAESSMRNHPLTPMWASRISELMKDQGKYKTYEITGDILNEGKNKVKNYIDGLLLEEEEHFYLALGYYNDDHAKKIIDIFGRLPLLTGSSGLAYELAKSYCINQNKKENVSNKAIDGRGIIISGSCSISTVNQIEDYICKCGYSLEISLEKLINGDQTVENLLDKIYNSTSKNILIYSCNKDISSYESNISQREKSEILEHVMAEIGKDVISNGFNKIIVAGGETSGSVTKALGFNSYLIGPIVSPGVPVLIPEGNTDIRIVLKSGNFGDRDFFTRALDLIEGDFY